MKKIYLLVVCSYFLIWFGCSNEDAEPAKNKLIGTWIEKYPEMFDGMSDTLVFTEDSIVKKHFFFKDWKYSFHNDTIYFQKAEKIRRYPIKFETDYEIIIYNFLEHSVSEQSYDVYFIKIN